MVTFGAFFCAKILKKKIYSPQAVSDIAAKWLCQIIRR